MDQQKLRTLVFEKTGVRIDIDDPVFALVALNEAVLAEAVERHVARIDEATRTLTEQALAHGGVARPAPAVLKALPATGASPSRAERRMIGIAAGAAVLGALLVLFGQALLFKPAPPIQAKEFSPAQAALIRNAEKLEQAVQKLDPTARTIIQAEMQK